MQGQALCWVLGTRCAQGPVIASSSFEPRGCVLQAQKQAGIVQGSGRCDGEDIDAGERSGGAAVTAAGRRGRRSKGFPEEARF